MLTNVFCEQDMVVSDVRICFSTTEIEQLWFTAGSTVLKSGINHVDVTCLVSALKCLKDNIQLKQTESPIDACDWRAAHGVSQAYQGKHDL